ncbi:MAG: nickel-responsive transcriptional regulator NikR [Bacteroidales bacterium]
MLKRFGVSLEEELLSRLDRLVEERNFPNRSQAIRYLIRDMQVRQRWEGEGDAEVAGAIVLVYDHHKRELQQQSTGIQHASHHLILSVQHVHLDHDHCLETIAVKGKASEINKLARLLIGMKGVMHGDLVITLPDKKD